MNRGDVKIGMGKTIAGIALGALLAVATPMLLLMELFSLTMVVLLPSIALVALYRWAGRGPALFSVILMLAFDYWFMGTSLMLAALFASILPPLVLLRMEDQPFFKQLQVSIVAFGAGVFAAVAVLYLSYGGNMIQRAMNLLPAVLRLQPEESLAPIVDVVSQIVGQTLTAESFYALYEAMIAQLIPEFQLQLPRLILSGALFSALACAWISNRMRARRGVAVPGSYVPLRGWALPASTTSGLLLILAVSGGMRIAGMDGANTAFNAVYGIAVVAFGAQAMGSMARRLWASPLSSTKQHVLLVVTLALFFLGASGVAAIYGCLSAIFGSRGMLQQRAQNRDNDGRFGGEE